MFTVLHNSSLVTLYYFHDNDPLFHMLTSLTTDANTYGPDIHNKFPQVFPDVPMAGEDVFLECLAYGRCCFKLFIFLFTNMFSWFIKFHAFLHIISSKHQLLAGCWEIAVGMVQTWDYPKLILLEVKLKC